MSAAQNVMASEPQQVQWHYVCETNDLVDKQWGLRPCRLTASGNFQFEDKRRNPGFRH